MIEIRVGPLHEAGTEALLRPVAADFAAVTGEGREVEVRSGEDVRRRLEALGRLPVGGAVVTPGGDLPVAFLIHVVVQSAEEPVSEAGIRRALLNGLRRASGWGVSTLALPPLGTGAGNLQPEESAQIMIPLLLEHLDTHDEPTEVTVTVPDDYEEEIFRRALERARSSEGGPTPEVSP